MKLEKLISSIFNNREQLQAFLDISHTSSYARSSVPCARAVGDISCTEEMLFIGLVGAQRCQIGAIAVMDDILRNKLSGFHILSFL